eukprot:GHVN01000541.1.p1 GENE.GHVN01000541.1~~GHVN01000541.1.p1  ORF type:complete len:359 (+),score=39.86 GHVN01000541.1:42-1118(+)
MAGTRSTRTRRRQETRVESATEELPKSTPPPALCEAKAMSSSPLTASVYGTKNCTTVRNTVTWLKSHNVTVEFNDFAEGKRDGDLESWIEEWFKELGWEKVLNQASRNFKALPRAATAKLNAEVAMSLLLDNPSMIKRPLVRLNGTRTATLTGFNQLQYGETLKIVEGERKSDVQVVNASPKQKSAPKSSAKSTKQSPAPKAKSTPRSTRRSTRNTPSQESQLSADAKDKEANSPSGDTMMHEQGEQPEDAQRRINHDVFCEVDSGGSPSPDNAIGSDPSINIAISLTRTLGGTSQLSDPAPKRDDSDDEFMTALGSNPTSVDPSPISPEEVMAHNKKRRIPPEAVASGNKRTRSQVI